MQLHRLAFLFGATSLLLVGAYACGGDDDSGTAPGTDAGTDTGTNNPADTGPTETPDTGTTVDSGSDAGEDGGDGGIPTLCIGNPLSADGGTYSVTLDGGAGQLFTVLSAVNFAYGPQYIDELGGQLVFSATLDHVVNRTAPDGGGPTNEIFELPDASFDPVGNKYYQGSIYTVVAQENVGGGVIYKTVVDAGTTTIAARFPATKVTSPNSIAISAQGIAYVTDPAFQFTPINGKSAGVYQMFLDGGALDGGAALNQFVTNAQAVGIAFNRDESRLYVSFAEGNVEWFNVTNGLVNPTVAGTFTTNASYTPSGIGIDQAGNVWVAEQGGTGGIVEVFNAAGTKLWATIRVPTYKPNGIAFGGADRTKVFISTENGDGPSAIYSLSTRCPGL